MPSFAVHPAFGVPVAEHGFNVVHVEYDTFTFFGRKLQEVEVLERVSPRYADCCMCSEWRGALSRGAQHTWRRSARRVR